MACSIRDPQLRLCVDAAFITQSAFFACNPSAHLETAVIDSCYAPHQAATWSSSPIEGTNADTDAGGIGAAALWCDFHEASLCGRYFATPPATVSFDQRLRFLASLSLEHHQPCVPGGSDFFTRPGNTDAALQNYHCLEQGGKFGYSEVDVDLCCAAVGGCHDNEKLVSAVCRRSQLTLGKKNLEELQPCLQEEVWKTQDKKKNFNLHGEETCVNCLQQV